jgi:hypothetical protein
MRLSGLGSGVALVVVMVATASRARAEPPAQVEASDSGPPEYPPPSTRWKVAGVGLGAAAAFYGAAAGLSYVYPDEPGMKDLRSPIVGPWIGISHNGCSASEPDCSTVLVAIRSVLMALDGVAQVGSLAVVLEGIFMPTQQVASTPRTEPRRAPSNPAPTTPPPSTPNPGRGDKNLFFVPAPMTVGLRGIGLGVVGRF